MKKRKLFQLTFKFKPFYYYPHTNIHVQCFAINSTNASLHSLDPHELPLVERVSFPQSRIHVDSCYQHLRFVTMTRYSTLSLCVVPYILSSLMHVYWL